jgi:hypothetical protein
LESFFELNKIKNPLQALPEGDWKILSSPEIGLQKSKQKTGL